MLEDPGSVKTTSSIQDSSTDINSEEMPPLSLPPNLKFGPFPISSQVFHLSPTRLSYGLVNLKPLLPGHVLICPVRCSPRLSQLTSAETADLFLTVQRVSKMLERVYSAAALNVAIQDGVEAGQSVPHVHVHIIPRQKGDMDSDPRVGEKGGDGLYDLMDGEEGDLGSGFLELWRARKNRSLDENKFLGGPDAERPPRTIEEMQREADWLRTEMEKEPDDGT